jgi:SagB-type dehydrogenase family enzyme
MDEGIGRRFQLETRYARRERGGAVEKPHETVLSGLVRPTAPTVPLPEPTRSGGLGLWDVVRGRRSVREFAPVPLELDRLSQLLWAAQGLSGGAPGLRNAPSAGACYPIETYVAANKVLNTAPGIYHHDLHAHCLELLREGDFRQELSEAALSQDFIAEAGAVLIWTAVFARTTRRYRDRGFRYVYLDAGHIGQNAALAAVSLGLGSCAVGAFFDDEVNAVIGVDGLEESVVYMTAVGRLPANVAV